MNDHRRFRPRLAQRGFSLIELLIVIAIIMTIAGIAMMKANQAIMSGHETAAITEIRTIHTAQVQYNSQFGRYAQSLAELGPPASGAASPAAADLLPKVLADGRKDGYVFSVAGTSTGYSVTAVPENYGSTGRRTYYSDQSLGIHYNMTQEPATAQSPEIGTVAATTTTKN